MKWFRLCLIVLLLFILYPGGINTIHAAEPPRTFRVGAYNNEPKIYKDNNDQPAGIWADILGYIAKKENWNLDYVWGTWDDGLTRLEKNEVDLMPDVAISDARKQRFDFTNETLLNSWAVIYVQKNSSINSITDLEGKKISILKSSVYESGAEGIKQYLKAFGLSATIMEVNNYREALDYLELGKADAAVVSYISGLANQKDYSNIKATKIFLEPAELRFALTKGAANNPYLVEKLDYWVKQLKNGQDNYLHQTLQKYGLQELETPSAPEEQQKEPESFLALKFASGVSGVLLSFGLIVMVISRQSPGQIIRRLTGKK